MAEKKYTVQDMKNNFYFGVAFTLLSLTLGMAIAQCDSARMKSYESSKKTGYTLAKHEQALPLYR